MRSFMDFLVNETRTITKVSLVSNMARVPLSVVV